MAGNIEVLNNIPFTLDTAALLSEVHVSQQSEDARDIHDLVKIAGRLARPKAVYKGSYIENRDRDKVCIDGVVFSSRVLSANLRAVERVFPYVATCGKELDELDVAPDNFARRYWLDTLKGMVLHVSLEFLYNHIRAKYALDKTATMSPGAADQDIWPIEQQRQLFSLFQNVEDSIGVKLTDSCLMIPNKSVSGILFATEVNFRSCQVCRRKNCPSRKAPFDKDLMRSYGHTVEE
jgi:hypothetical protein